MIIGKWEEYIKGVSPKFGIGHEAISWLTE